MAKMIKELVEKGNEKLEELVIKHPNILKIVGGAVGLGISGLYNYNDIVKYGINRINNIENYTYNFFFIASGYAIGKLLANKIKNIAELKETNNAKDKMFSIIAHDLRSPFHSILGLTEVLTEDYNILNDDEKIEYIKGINKKSKEMYQTLEYLLEWARAQMGGVEYKPKYNNLATLVNKNIIDYQLNQKTKDKGIKLINKVDLDTEAFYDDNLLSRVVVNLVSNAIKFTDNGGRIEVGAKYNGDNLEVYVSDTGKGIAKENIDKLWGINFTTHGTNGEKGTGLGLSVCKEFVEMNKGKIYVESEIGKGSKFIFTVPIKDYQANSQQNK